MKKKQVIKMCIGIPLIIFGLFHPFYIGGELLPKDWQFEAWYGLPMFLLLVVDFVLCVGFGAYIAFDDFMK